MLSLLRSFFLLVVFDRWIAPPYAFPPFFRCFLLFEPGFAPCPPPALRSGAGALFTGAPFSSLPLSMMKETLFVVFPLSCVEFGRAHARRSQPVPTHPPPLATPSPIWPLRIDPFRLFIRLSVLRRALSDVPFPRTTPTSKDPTFPPFSPPFQPRSEGSMHTLVGPAFPLLFFSAFMQGTSSRFRGRPQWAFSVPRFSAWGPPPGLFTVILAEWPPYPSLRVLLL